MPKQVDHDERRRELALAAWRVIAERGIEEVTMREVAREAGYSAGILGHYFKNKDDMLVHALRVAHEQVTERYDAELAAAADGRTQESALTAILFDNLPLDRQRNLETRVELSFWARCLRNADVSAVQDIEAGRHREMIRGLVAEAQAAGELSAELDVDLVVDLLRPLIDGVSLHGLLYPERLTPARQRTIMEFALGLLAPSD